MLSRGPLLFFALGCFLVLGLGGVLLRSWGGSSLGRHELLVTSGSTHRGGGREHHHRHREGDGLALA